MLVIVIGLILPVMNGMKAKTFRNEMSLHSMAHDAYKDTTGETEDGTVRMRDSNVINFKEAVTRTGLATKRGRRGDCSSVLFSGEKC